MFWGGSKGNIGKKMVNKITTIFLSYKTPIGESDAGNLIRGTDKNFKVAIISVVDPNAIISTIKAVIFLVEKTESSTRNKKKWLNRKIVFIFNS